MGNRKSVLPVLSRRRIESKKGRHTLSLSESVKAQSHLLMFTKRVARILEFRHEYASAVTRAAGGFCRERLGTSRVAKIEFTNWQFFEPHLIEDRCSRGSNPKPISQEKPSPRSGESSSRTELERRDHYQGKTSRLKISQVSEGLCGSRKSNPKYMQAYFADAVLLSQYCVSEIGEPSSAKGNE